MEREWRITIELVRKIFQKGRLVTIDLLSFLGHPALVFECTLNQRSDPTLDDVSMFLASITERLEEWPESTHNAPPERDLLNLHKCIHKAVESIVTTSQSIKAVSEEELGCGVDGKPSSQVFKVNGLVRFEIGDVVESLADVFVEESKI